MKEYQNLVKDFNDELDWSNPSCIKDLLLNMTEEIGEFWNIIKWVDVETQLKLLKENKAEVENFVGDMLYLVFKLAYLCDVDSEKALKDVLDEYNKRFPVDKAKGTHANTLAGGIDLKNQQSE